ncbi:LamB/YcsF family protein [Fomitopsis betulina]|nr:LamB/YcsF family protein [Fomitopsis betulina]
MRASVNCDMGERQGDDEALMKTIHLANIACGFHASDFNIMNTTVLLAKQNGVKIGAHPSLPDRQGWGRREMVMEPDELASCFTYQVGALTGFLKLHGVELNHIKPHGAVYGMTARDINLARAAVGVAKLYGVPYVGLAGTCHQVAAKELGVPFIAEYYADMEYAPDGKLLITKKHDPIPLDVIKSRVSKVLSEAKVTTNDGSFLPLASDITDFCICIHSDTPGSVEIATTVKNMVDVHNARLQ